MDSIIEQKNRVTEMKTSLSSVVHEPIQAKMWCFIRRGMGGHAASCPASSGANRGQISAETRQRTASTALHAPSSHLVSFLQGQRDCPFSCKHLFGLQC